MSQQQHIGQNQNTRTDS